MSADLTREQKLTLIYRHTHADYKGKAGERWGEDAGKRTIVVNRGGSTLSLLDHLTDAEIADALPSAQRMEAKRLAKKAATK
ncbi:hypothetical protein ACU4GI_32645 [Cupriavidus basilensis]